MLSYRKMDIYISKVLTQVQPLLTYRISNSEQLQDKVKQLPLLTTPHIQASLDIENMFPCVPIDKKALDIIKECLKKHRTALEFYGIEICHIMIILEFILNNTYTKIEDKYYQQTSGLGTGSCTSTAYADIIVDWTYTQAISLSVISPKLLYVDDGYPLWPDKEDTFLKFKDLINSIWPSLNFTHKFSNSKN